MWLLKPKVDGSGFDDEEIRREEGGRKYKIVTREYMALGHDGYEPLLRGKWLVDRECGSTFSCIVRSYLLGMNYKPGGSNLILIDLAPLQERNLSKSYCSQRTSTMPKFPSKHGSSLTP
jgi:hypothetical protein